MDIKLTQHSKGGGCGCKIAPSVLSEILAAHNVGAKNNIPQLLVGNDSRDDAAVYQIDKKMPSFLPQIFLCLLWMMHLLLDKLQQPMP